MIEAGNPSKQAMILLHGSGSNSIMWLEEIVKFSSDYHVFAIDILGEPGFSEENRPSLSGEEYNEWLNQVFDVLKIESVILAGISLGGFLAAKYAINHGDRVSNLILISPSGIGRQKGSFLGYSLWYLLQGQRGVKKLYTKINGNKEIPTGTMEYLLLLQRNFIYRKETIPIFTDIELKKLSMPVALFIGTKDIMLDSSDTEKRLKQNVSNVMVFRIEGGGHSLGSQYLRINSFLSHCGV